LHNIQDSNYNIKAKLQNIKLKREKRGEGTEIAKPNAFLNLSIEARHGFLAVLRRSLFLSLKLLQNSKNENGDGKGVYWVCFCSQVHALKEANLQAKPTNRAGRRTAAKNKLTQPGNFRPPRAVMSTDFPECRVLITLCFDLDCEFCLSWVILGLICSFA